MLTLPASVRIYVAAEALDLRRGFDGLAAAVRSVIREDPLSGHLFVFTNRRRNRVKVLVWDRTGYLLLYKRLERGTFHLAMEPAAGCRHVELDAGELGMAPDLSGYGSRDWLIGMISDPTHERFYRDANDRMPSFAAHQGASPENLLSPESIGLIVDWLRGEWYEPAADNDATVAGK